MLECVLSECLVRVRFGTQEMASVASQSREMVTDDSWQGTCSGRVEGGLEYEDFHVFVRGLLVLCCSTSLKNVRGFGPPPPGLDLDDPLVRKQRSISSSTTCDSDWDSDSGDDEEDCRMLFGNASDPTVTPSTRAGATSASTDGLRGSGGRKDHAMPSVPPFVEFGIFFVASSLLVAITILSISWLIDTLTVM